MPRPPPEREVEEDGLSAGLVSLVTALVKVARFPTTPLEKAATELITEAAASAPGSLGRVTVMDLPPLGGVGLLLAGVLTLPLEVRLSVGSARYHQ